MYPSIAIAEEIMRTAVTAVLSGDQSLLAIIDDLPLAIYAVDVKGYVTYFNPRCIAFSGRQPVLRKDRWCVSWKLFTDDGVYLPHAFCPVATAARDRCVVRGVTAVAERPDGSRVNFMPFPTPMLGADGALIGVVNMMIDLGEPEPEELETGYGGDLAPWCCIAVERTLASFSIAEIRALVIEIEQGGAVEQPHLLN